MEADTFSPIMIVGALRFAFVITGITDASATRSPFTPFTLPNGIHYFLVLPNAVLYIDLIQSIAYLNWGSNTDMGSASWPFLTKDKISSVSYPFEFKVQFSMSISSTYKSSCTTWMINGHRQMTNVTFIISIRFEWKMVTSTKWIWC